MNSFPYLKPTPCLLFLIRPFTYLPFIISVKSYALIHFEIRVSTYELQSKQSSPFPLWIRQEHRQASLQAGHSMHSSSLPCYAEHDPSIPQSLSREPSRHRKAVYPPVEECIMVGTKLCLSQDSFPSSHFSNGSDDIFNDFSCLSLSFLYRARFGENQDGPWETGKRR